MSEQKVVICKDLKSELQDFLSSLKYDKLFILMDTNTKEKCFPLVEDIPAFQKAPILVMEAGDMIMVCLISPDRSALSMRGFP